MLELKGTYFSAHIFILIVFAMVTFRCPDVGIAWVESSDNALVSLSN